jgi:hypothetical protein
MIRALRRARCGRAQDPQCVEQLRAEVRGPSRLPGECRQRLEYWHVAGVGTIAGFSTPDRDEELTLDPERGFNPLEKRGMAAHHFASARDKRWSHPLR